MIKQYNLGFFRLHPNGTLQNSNHYAEKRLVFQKNLKIALLKLASSLLQGLWEPCCAVI